MSIGSLKTLLTMLQAAPSLAGISVVYGEEFINAQDEDLPMIVMVPTGGTWDTPSYIRELNPDVNIDWSTIESMDFYIWNYAPGSNMEPIDHADSVEDTRARLLMAFQSQRPRGLFYKPLSGRWASMQNQVTRFGRAYILTIAVEIGVPDVLPEEATILDTTLTATIQVG